MYNQNQQYAQNYGGQGQPVYQQQQQQQTFGYNANAQHQGYAAQNGYPQPSQNAAGFPQQHINQPSLTPYNAYPEFDPQASGSSKSFQNQRVAGWNEPPIATKSKINADEILKNVDSPESKIVTILTEMLDSLKATIDPSKARMLQDGETRIEVLMEKLGNNMLSHEVIARVYQILTLLQRKDYVQCKDKITELMTLETSETKWILGLKRCVELSIQFIQ
jgi:hypothetical protein